MPRYIDADALYNKLYPLDLVDKKTYAINAKAVADAIAKTPTADVVQMAEVEELKAENERLTDLVKELQGYNEAWVEDNGKLRKKNKNLAREIFELVECAFSPVLMYEGHTIKAYIAELKKKYTGGDQT